MPLYAGRKTKPQGRFTGEVKTSATLFAWKFAFDAFAWRFPASLFHVKHIAPCRRFGRRSTCALWPKMLEIGALCLVSMLKAAPGAPRRHGQMPRNSALIILCRARGGHSDIGGRGRRQPAEAADAAIPAMPLPSILNAKAPTAMHRPELLRNSCDIQLNCIFFHSPSEHAPRIRAPSAAQSFAHIHVQKRQRQGRTHRGNDGGVYQG